MLVSAIHQYEISCRYACVPSLLTVPPPRGAPPTPPHPSTMPQSVSYSKFALAVLHTVMHRLQSVLSVCPTLSFPHCVSKPVLYVCVSVALQMRASVRSSYYREKAKDTDKQIIQ